MANLVSRDFGNCLTTWREISQVVSNVNGSARRTNERQAVCCAIANIIKAGNALNKVQIDHVSIRATNSARISIGNDPVQVTRCSRSGAGTDIRKRVINLTCGQKFDVDVGLAENLIDAILNICLLSRRSKKFSLIGAVRV